MGLEGGILFLEESVLGLDVVEVVVDFVDLALFESEVGVQLGECLAMGVGEGGVGVHIVSRRVLYNIVYEG